MTEPSAPSRQAVFLSYASQDAEAAQRICEALRAAGLEAWFDQSELRGGDAWDQKIRRQIKECALFMPLVSANTNARAEGYFRLEWKLAVDRSHLMAEDAPFIFPVAIDAGSEQEARVPERFRELQWMRLGRDTPEAIAKRARKLLAGEAKVAVRSDKPRFRIRSKYFWPLFGAAIAAFFITQPMWRPTPSKRTAAAPAAAPAQASDAAAAARRALAQVTTPDYTRDTLAIAAEAAKKASEQDSTLALAWGVRARVEAIWLQRNWDVGEARRRTAQEYARRALALDPDEPNALWAQGTVLRVQRALPEAEASYARALKAAPNDNYIRRSLGSTQGLQGRNDQAIATYQEILRREPGDGLTHTALAVIHANTTFIRDNDPANLDVALGHLDRAIEAQPRANALIWKALHLAAWKDDMAGAKAAVDRIAALPHEEATEDRSIFTRMFIALLDRDPERALSVAALTTSTYFADTLVGQPVAWLKALAHQEAKRESAAAQEWRAAEKVLRERLAANPDALLTQAELAVTLAMLGRKEEATKQFARYDAAMREQGRTSTVTQIHFHAAMGDTKRAVAALRESRKGTPIWSTDAVLARDPWFDRIRDKPEFKALVAR